MTDIRDTSDTEAGHATDAATGAPPLEAEIGLANNPVRLLLLVALFAALGVFFGVGVLVILGAIVVSIFLHEMGHYLVARWTGMKATEFFIGFGPKLWSFKRGETEFGIKLVWLGAYVKVIGMNNLEDVPEQDEGRTYREQSYPRRVLMAFAGPAMNLALALVIMFVLFAGVGIPNTSFPISGVAVDTPAEDAGLQSGDTIVAVDGVATPDWHAAVDELEQFPGETVQLDIERDGEPVAVEVTLGERTNPDGETVGFLGVRAGESTVREPPLEAAGSSAEAFGHVTYQSVAGLARFFSPAGLGDFARQVASPPESVEEQSQVPATTDPVPAAPPSGSAEPTENEDRIISILGVIQIGKGLPLADVLALMAALNVFLALFNLVPLLPFDGGHIAVATYERVRSRKGVRYHADYAKLIPVTYVVVALIVSVGLGALYLDAVSPVELPQ